MALNTMVNFKKLVILENFFCVSRPYLIENRKTKFICNTIFLTFVILIIGNVILDLITFNQGLGARIFQTIMIIELIALASESRLRKANFTTIKRLDEKCGEDKEYALKIQSLASKIVLMSVSSLIVDLVGLRILGVSNSFSLFICVAFAAHEAEMAFFFLLVESINLRLEELKNTSPIPGCRIYRHVLIATAHISEQYYLKILLLLGVSLITTIANELIVILIDSQMKDHLILYLVWRESKSMFSLWMMCSAVAKTNSVCNNLALHLAGRLTIGISKEKNPIQFKACQRWYSVVVTQRPRYISGCVLSIGLSTPILLLDQSINYMLIIVQMYLAYK